MRTLWLLLERRLLWVQNRLFWRAAKRYSEIELELENRKGDR